MKDIKVYVVNADDIEEETYLSAYDIQDWEEGGERSRDFKDLAERTGYVLTLTEFQNKWNLEEISMNTFIYID